MQRLLFTCLLTLLGKWNAGAQPPPVDPEIAIIHANVLTMTDGPQILEDQTVVIRKGKIHRLGPAARTKPGRKATVIDAGGRYLMPGLTEMHAHIPVPRDGDDALVRETLFLYLSCGVTTIRGMLGDPYHLSLRTQAEEGDLLSPRIFTSSPSLNGNTVQTVEEARQKVTQYQRDGYDFLKIHPGIKREVFDEIVRTARQVGITFSGHVPAEVGIRHALASRYASIDHVDGFLEGLASGEDRGKVATGGFFGYNLAPFADEEQIAVLAGETRRQGIWIVPTQSLFTRWFSPEDPAALANEPEMQYMPSRTLYQWRQSKQNLIGDPAYNESQWRRFIDLRQKVLRAMDQAGVDLLLGSDAPQVFNVPGFSLRHEVKSLIEAGLSPYTILGSGTVNPARFFGQRGRFGTIGKGASADLLLLEGNPLEHIDALWQQTGVMVRGRWLPRAFIEARLAEIAAGHQAE